MNEQGEQAGPDVDGARGVPPATQDPRRWLALTVIAAATLMVVLDTSVVNLALPRAQAELRMSDTTRGWVVTTYTVAFGGLLLLGGRVGDLVGRKLAFLVGLVGFGAASALGGLAPNAEVLFTARAGQGVFAALLAPAALSLVSVTFVEPAERATAFAVYGAVAGGGGAVGLILGGLLTEYASWRWCLFVNVPIALVAAVAAVKVVPHDEVVGGSRRYDVPGALTITAASMALVYGVTLAGQNAGWLATGPVVLLLAAGVLGAAFVAVERRSASPLLPLRVVTDRIRGGSFATSALISAGMFAMFLLLAYYLQVDLGLSPVRAGLAILPFSIGLVTTATAAARLLPRWGPRPLMTAGTGAATLAMAWLALASSTGYWSGIFPAMLVMGVGLGFVFTTLSSVALTGVEPTDAGVASALLNATQQLGGAVGVALLNTLYTASLTSAAAAGATTRQAHLSGYRLAFAVAAGLFAAALAVVILTIRRLPTRELAIGGR